MQAATMAAAALMTLQQATKKPPLRKTMGLVRSVCVGGSLD
jgi:hypothetical protein